MSMEQAISKTYSSVRLFSQIFALTISNRICWIPSSVIYLVCHFLEKYLAAVVVWVMVVLDPFNSVTDPIVISSTTFKKIFKL